MNRSFQQPPPQRQQQPQRLLEQSPQRPTIAQWLAEPPSPEVAQSLRRLAKAEDIQHMAVMPDVHLASEICVGVALATRELVYPAAVGSDIGCGMAAVQLRGDAALLAEQRRAARLLDGLYRRVPVMRHARETMPEAIPEALQMAPLSCSPLERLKQRDGRVQLGTLGRGNHFLEFQADEQQRLWLMIHSGSRGMGEAISAHHRTLAQQHALATATAQPTAEPSRQVVRQGMFWALVADSELGKAYLADVAWAQHYASQNRLAMVEAVAELVEDLFGIGMDRESLIHSDHNHVRRETHGGVELWVHRKGALSAQAGEAGVIPGSMGTASFHVVGRGCEQALCSSSHGAGRVKSRGEARKSISTKRLLGEMADVWFDERQAKRLCDEAPSAYKDIHAVMRAQRELTRVARRLQPLLSYKGGS